MGESVFGFCASLKLAIFVIVGLVALIAYGTIVEAKYGEFVARHLVYRSLWMKLVMSLLGVNIISVMIDRLPWKKRHLGFLLAHIGIICVIVGSYITQRWGIDGLLSVKVGETSGVVLFPGQFLLDIYHAPVGEDFRKIESIPTDFLLKSPGSVSYSRGIGGLKMHVMDFMPYAKSQPTVVEGSAADGPGVQFELKNGSVNLVQWILRRSHQSVSRLDLGPLEVVVVEEAKDLKIEVKHPKNKIILLPHATKIAENHKFPRLRYFIVEGGRVKKEGVLGADEKTDTGWMGMQFGVLKYLPHGRKMDVFTKLERPEEGAATAIKLDVNGQTSWLGIGGVHPLAVGNDEYAVSFVRDSVPLGFNLTLKSIHIEKYRASDRDLSYESRVIVDGSDEVSKIQMNEPFSSGGFTFYQSGVQRNALGEAMASTFTVNKDPGRLLKYAGALLVVFGTLTMFYMRRRHSIVFAKFRGEEND